MSTATGNPPRLSMLGISKAYPGTQALDGADLDVAPGEVHCLLGENGAGKSTLVKVLAGVEDPDAGTVLLDGKPVTFTGPHEGIRAGISVIYQELDLVGDLTVSQNLFLGDAPTRWGVVRRRERDAAAGEAIARVGGCFEPHAVVNTLSVGNQQLVAIARALATDARLIVMDEPSATLTEHELPRIFELVRELAREGRSIIYISHRLDEVLDIGDRATVLRDGRTVARVKLASATEDDLVTAMIGHRPERSTRPRQDFSQAPPALEVDRAVVTDTIDVTGLVIRPGEVVGLAGLGGAGRTTLLDVVFGARTSHDLQARVAGRTYQPRSPGDAVAAGLGLVPEDRKGKGLLRELSVVRNAALVALPIGSLRPGSRGRSLSSGPLKNLAVRYSDGNQPVGQLSGGNQQKVVLAKWLARGISVLLLDEPTRGIDVGAKGELYRQVRVLADGGTAVLMASSELSELYANADVIWVMFEGRNIARFDPREDSEADIARAVVTGKAPR